MDGIGLVFVVTFYLAILICGVWVARRKDVINGASTTKVSFISWIIRVILNDHYVILFVNLFPFQINRMT